MARVFSLCSCRVWKAVERAGLYGPPGREGACVHAHYVQEIAQYVDWLLTRPALTAEQAGAFRTPPTLARWTALRASFAAATHVVVELSSPKCALPARVGGPFPNLLLGAPTRVLEPAALGPLVRRLAGVLAAAGKAVLWVPHVSVFHLRYGGRNALRERLRPALATGGVPRTAVLDPNRVVAEFGKTRCLARLTPPPQNPRVEERYDHNHYTDFLHERLGRGIAAWVRSGRA